MDDEIANAAIQFNRMQIEQLEQISQIAFGFRVTCERNGTDRGACAENNDEPRRQEKRSGKREATNGVGGGKESKLVKSNDSYDQLNVIEKPVRPIKCVD